MFRLSLKNLAAHKMRFVGTSLAVILGVGFMAGALVLTDTIAAGFNGLFADVNEGTDVVIRSGTALEGEFGGVERPRIPDALVPIIEDVDGVAAAGGSVEQEGAVYEGKDGKRVGSAGGAPAFVRDWPEVEELNPWVLVDGRAPTAPGEVVADKSTADRGDFAVGDTVKLETAVGPLELELVGIAKFGTADGTLGATHAILETSYAQEVGGEPGEFNEIRAVADEGVSQGELAGRISAALAASDQADVEVEVITGEQLTSEQQTDIEENLAFFDTFLLVFAGIALFVGSFIIYNTFSIIVTQRSREMALLRAVGASRRQVLGTIMVEAILLGLLASGLGILLGILGASGLKAALNSFGLEIPAGAPVVTSGTIITCLVVGEIITVLAAVFPARRAAKIPPIAAMREIAIDTSGRSRKRGVLGVVVLVLGVASLANGLFGGGESAGQNVGIGALLIFVGVAVLGPIIAVPASKLIGLPLTKVRGITGNLARENAIRNPKRTASTAAALMIGVGIIAFIGIFAESLKASINETIDDTFVGDFVVAQPGFGLGFSPQLTEELAALPQVETVTAFRGGLVQVDGEADFLIAGDATSIGDILDVTVEQGSFDGLGATQIAVHDELAERRGWSVGSKVSMRFAETGIQELEIAAIYEKNELLGKYLVGLEAYEANFADQRDLQAVITIPDDLTAEEARVAIEAVTDEYISVELQDLAEFKESFTSQINALLGLIFVLLALAVVIAVLGIVNTLSLSVIERTRELGLLRAVGMTRVQVRSMVRWESVIIALLGTFLGLGLGLFFGWSIVKALEEEGFSHFRVPIAQMAIVVVVSIVFGVLAALWPAHKAARLDVLKAISTE